MIRFLMLVAMFGALELVVQAQDAGSSEDKSTFIVSGTVTKQGHSPSGENSVLLNIDGIQKSPIALGDLKGQQVRILIKSDASVIEGGKYTFYAVGDSASDILTLRELNHYSGTSNFRPGLMSLSVARRYADSDVIVKGKILNIMPAPSTATPEAGIPVIPPSEHRSKPQVVQLRVTKLLQGELQTTIIPVVVETSEDIAHVSGESGDLGILQIGKTDIFALRWDEDQKAWTASKATDIQPEFQLSSIMNSVTAMHASDISRKSIAAKASKKSGKKAALPSSKDQKPKPTPKE